MKVYIGNLSFETSESDLRGLFDPHGAVASASLVMDRDTGRSRGFAFVEMTDDTQAKAAIAALNGQPFQGRSLNVNEAKSAGPARRDRQDGAPSAGTGGRAGW